MLLFIQYFFNMSVNSSNELLVQGEKISKDNAILELFEINSSNFPSEFVDMLLESIQLFFNKDQQYFQDNFEKVCEKLENLAKKNKEVENYCYQIIAYQRMRFFIDFSYALISIQESDMQPD